MSRYDREDVDFLNLPDPNPTIVNYYIKGGISLDREQYEQTDNQSAICAKEIQNKETKITTFYVLCNSLNQMFDPKDKDTRYGLRDQWKFRRVNRPTFDLYVSFLKNNYKSLLSQAERGL